MSLHSAVSKGQCAFFYSSQAKDKTGDEETDVYGCIWDKKWEKIEANHIVCVYEEEWREQLVLSNFYNYKLLLQLLLQLKIYSFKIFVLAIQHLYFLVI